MNLIEITNFFKTNQNVEKIDVVYDRKIETIDKSLNLHKVTNITSNVGKDYETLDMTIENRSNGMQKSTRKSNTTWLIENILSFNSNTNKYKLRLDLIENEKSLYDYYLIDERNNKITVSNDFAKSLIKQKSNNSNFKTSVLDLCIENIVSISRNDS